ncbi:Protein of unknown function [Gryllus bimaculatus]|nr:Protein of unknown function [Gryllus bimaculatus]
MRTMRQPAPPLLSALSEKGVTRRQHKKPKNPKQAAAAATVAAAAATAAAPRRHRRRRRAPAAAPRRPPPPPPPRRRARAGGKRPARAAGWARGARRGGAAARAGARPSREGAAAPVNGGRPPPRLRRPPSATRRSADASASGSPPCGPFLVTKPSLSTSTAVWRAGSSASAAPAAGLGAPPPAAGRPRRPRRRRLFAGPAQARLLVLAPRVLDEPRAVLLALPPQPHLVGPRLHLVQLPRFLDGVALPREEVLGERVQDVHAEHEVALADGDIHRHDLVLVRLVDLQGRLQHVQEVGQLVVADVLRAVGIEVLPDLVVHVVIVVRQPLLHVLRGLRMTARKVMPIPISLLGRWQSSSLMMPSSTPSQPADVDICAAGGVCDFHSPPPPLHVHLLDDESESSCCSERTFVFLVHVVDAALLLDVHEERHAEDGEDEHDEEEQQADVEERRQRHGQREQQRADALRALHQAQHSAHLGHAHHAQQRRRHEVLLDDVAQHQACAPRPASAARPGRRGGARAWRAGGGAGAVAGLERPAAGCRVFGFRLPGFGAPPTATDSPRAPHGTASPGEGVRACVCVRACACQSFSTHRTPNERNRLEFKSSAISRRSEERKRKHGSISLQHHVI